MPSEFGHSLGHTNPITGLLPFLKQALQHLLPTATRTAASLPRNPVYVLGNQSADLDSIVSAVLYSYFFSRSTQSIHVPLVNLPDVPSGTELRRLRPEFACAFGLATSKSSKDREKLTTDAGEDGIVRLLRDHIITVADLRARLLSSNKLEKGGEKLELDAVLVDWNKPPHSISEETTKEGKKIVKGSIDGLADLATFSIAGCIDHHADEGFVPSAEDLVDSSNPRVIELGPGSCTSLIIREVQRRGLWPSSSSSAVDEPHSADAHADAELAKLALAAILIDTTNLTAEGKVTDVDRDAVSFLTRKIEESAPFRAGTEVWDQKALFEEVQYAKAHSLDWLTVDEILGRDYKDWTETMPSGDTTVIGIASVVRPLSWIIAKANEENGLKEEKNLNSLLEKTKQFAGKRSLDVVAIMTAFTSKKEEFQRELLLWVVNEKRIEQGEIFVESAREELQLEKWSQFPFDGRQEVGRLYIWKQANLGKSRKQVAPLLREVYT
ncbi:hypothetical protein BGW36DRAFT_264341, partial [Talaromyces proteolyticus]